MNAYELTLNIAVNMGRLARWATEAKTRRLEQFLAETQKYLTDLEKTPMRQKFLPTFNAFKLKFSQLKNTTNYNDVWAEEALTWANILTHRAKLA